MSMFHELMMRKKEQIMYATIKGTLTESPEGVFSGFSASNYLSLSGNVVTDFEIGISFTTGSDVSSQQVIWGQDISSGVQILANGSMKFSVNSAHSTGTEAILTYKLSANTTYKFVALKKSDKSMSLTLYDTLGNILDTASAVSVNNNVNITSFIGRNTGTSYYFKGAVNITNSYIKLGSTKYNLQAVVGYTVVGSPTIVDGVVSGFSNSDYLQLNIINNDIIKANYLTNFEFQVKAILPNSFDKEQQIIYVPYRGVLSGFTIIENGKIRWYAMGGINVITSSTTFTGGTTIWIKGTVKNSVATLYSSIDGINWINEGSVTFTNFEYTALVPVRIGVDGQSTPGSIFNGSIDLNETYIKINNKLWFNGQPA